MVREGREEVRESGGGGRGDGNGRRQQAASKVEGEEETGMILETNKTFTLVEHGSCSVHVFGFLPTTPIRLVRLHMLQELLH